MSNDKDQSEADALSSSAGASSANQEALQRSIQEAMKNLSDTNVEELLAYMSGLLSLNAKRTYDVHQSLDLGVLSDGNVHRTRVQTLAETALANAVFNSDSLAKQHLAHRDIATDRQWNVDEQGYQVNEILRSETFKDAIAGAVAVAVATALKETE